MNAAGRRRITGEEEMGKTKYIDVERYINNLRELRTGDKDTVYEYYDDGIDVAISEAAIFPAADVVEVVRCKDCQYRYVLNRGGSSICNLLDAQNNGEAYCSYGERKDG